jgi:prefoldin subunit 5
MIFRIALVASAVLIPSILMPAAGRAQDVPGIEICTVEKTMERRTSCLQSNVDFLMKTITKLGADHQQKLDAASRQIDGLKSAVVSLQKTVNDLQTAQKAAEDAKKKTDAPAAKEGAK